MVRTETARALAIAAYDFPSKRPEATSNSQRVNRLRTLRSGRGLCTTYRVPCESTATRVLRAQKRAPMTCALAAMARSNGVREAIAVQPVARNARAMRPATVAVARFRSYAN